MRRRPAAWFAVHLDAVQCAGKIPVCLHGMDVDYASVSAHKLHGPKGIGCLYRRSGVPLEPALFGGGQEYGLRSGTENVPGIIGFGARPAWPSGMWRKRGA